ncbi:MAG: ABC transporter ATP-binding protein [Bacillota bacterium]|jgi:ABC-2 type transport system ATP-binding protein
MEYALKLQNVCKSYPDFSLSDINITLPQGSIMGFIGANGAGKSTTIKLILDLIRRDSGQITVLGHDNRRNFIAIKEQIGVVMDETCFPESLCAKNIHSIMKNIYKNWQGEKFAGLLQRFSLPPEKVIKEYSRGMKMKLALAAALSHNARLLILDEATSGLDPMVREEILEVFMDFIKDERHSIFISSHILSDLEKICDRITFIHEGKIIFSQPKQQLLADYGLLKCSADQFADIDKSAVKAYRSNRFGIEALVYKQKMAGDNIADASIEDIMLYHIKENIQ